ncbi:MAG TPA: PxKF domain-containing protein [Candidatus Manganitrophaceae bacterium]|nr:PxKF domain-containing protein [Candidatus Manganitrophaceae bacterium]
MRVGFSVVLQCQPDLFFNHFTAPNHPGKDVNFTLTLTHNAISDEKTSRTHLDPNYTLLWQTPVTLAKKFTLGSTIPVKFQLIDKATQLPLEEVKTAYFWAVHKTNQTLDPSAPESFTAVPDTGGVFIYDPVAKIYRYNWRTDNREGGAWELHADLGDGVDYLIPIQLE